MIRLNPLSGLSAPGPDNGGLSAAKCTTNMTIGAGRPSHLGAGSGKANTKGSRSHGETPSLSASSPRTASSATQMRVSSTKSSGHIKMSSERGNISRSPKKQVLPTALLNKVTETVRQGYNKPPITTKPVTETVRQGYTKPSIATKPRGTPLHRDGLSTKATASSTGKLDLVAKKQSTIYDPAKPVKRTKRTSVAATILNSQKPGTGKVTSQWKIPGIIPSHKSPITTTQSSFVESGLVTSCAGQKSPFKMDSESICDKGSQLGPTLEVQPSICVALSDDLIPSTRDEALPETTLTGSVVDPCNLKEETDESIEQGATENMDSLIKSELSAENISTDIKRDPVEDKPLPTDVELFPVSVSDIKMEASMESGTGEVLDVSFEKEKSEGPISKKTKKRSKKRKKLSDADESVDADGEAAKQRKLPPNFFVAVQIEDNQILENARAVQKHVLTQQEALSPSAVPIATSHLTLLVLRLDDAEAERRACSALSASAQVINDAIWLGETFHIHTLGNFRHNVLFAHVHPGRGREQLQKIADVVVQTFGQHGLHPSDSKGYKPHMTLMKLSRAPNLRKKGISKIDPDLYADFNHLDFGTQSITNIQLCAMMKPKREDGYYHIEHLAPIGNRRREIFKAQLRKCLNWNFHTSDEPPRCDTAAEGRNKETAAGQDEGCAEVAANDKSAEVPSSETASRDDQSNKE